MSESCKIVQILRPGNALNPSFSVRSRVDQANPIGIYEGEDLAKIDGGDQPTADASLCILFESALCFLARFARISRILSRPSIRRLERPHWSKPVLGYSCI